ncbi:MAG: A-macroglobulin complement component [Planctomycetes bacterium]|nr:A-macroglobulin complement component [Planctomycetota bacterium]
MKPTHLAAAVLTVAVTLVALPLLGQEPAGAGATNSSRFLLHLATDRPTYRPGDTVHLRGALLHAFDRRPARGSGMAQVEVKGPRGDTVAKGFVSGSQPGLSFAWKLADDLAGGIYTAKVSPQPGYPPAEVTFEVRAFRTPRLNTDLQFVRKVYGPGDTAEATLEVTRVEGGAPGGAKATCIARVDGAEVFRRDATLDRNGKLLVQFTLPATIQTPDATLLIVIEDGGVQETAARTIPLSLGRLDVAFYPEGGDLVAGLPTRVYLEARTLTQDPADVRGRVVDADGATVARFSTEHEGRGRFDFTPAPGGVYRAVLDEPAGILEPLALPAVKAQGVSLTSTAQRYAHEASLEFELAANLPEDTAQLVISQRDVELCKREVALSATPTKVAIGDLPAWAAGVLTATLYDAQGRPYAERLVFRDPQPGVQAKVELSPDRSTPRGQVKLTVTTTDAAGAPTPAWVFLSLVDDAVLERQDPRDRAARLPAQVLLADQVFELKDAQEVWQDPAKLDLLLGTQGWRRFRVQRSEAFVKEHGDRALRLLAKKGDALPIPRQELRRARLGAMAPEADGAELEDAMGGAEFEGAPPPAPMPQDAPVMEEQDLDAPADDPRPAKDDANEQQLPAEAGRADALRQQPKAKREAFADEEMGAMPDADFARKPMSPPFQQGPFVVVRQFAHTPKPGAERTDFAETVYWNGGTRTNEQGVFETTVSLSDSITTFRARVDVVGEDGSLASADATVEAVRPFYMEPKLPLEITSTDEVQIPVSVINSTNQATQASITVEAGTSQIATRGRALPANSRERFLVSIGDVVPGEHVIRLIGVAGSEHEAVHRPLKVVAPGFPMHHDFGGLLSSEAPLIGEVTIPEQVSPLSLVTEAKAYPTPLASLTEALAALLREPSGCFEQTSSTNYPNVMAMQYLRSHRGVDPALVSKTAGLLDRGLARLVSFECKEKGYEWFGGDPGHEALSAYGLLEFSDMAAVGCAVDDGMVARTRGWLLSRRDGEGGFKRNERALDSFGGAPPETTNAYITWALAEAGETGIAKEIDAVVEGALASKDAYVLALAANICLKAGQLERAKDLAGKLAEAQTAEGDVAGALTSITRSGGLSLQLETTSLAVLAWLRLPDYTLNLERGMTWLLEQCKGGRFGSTQATVLTLRAIVAYDALKATPRKPGEVQLYVDGDLLHRVPFSAEHEGPVELPAFYEQLTPGTHSIELRMQGGSPLPASVQIAYRTPQPPSSDACKVAISTALADTHLVEGEGTELTVTVTNTTAEGLPMTMAIVGIPGGMEARPEQLEELKRAGRIDFVETRAREVILYWRDLEPNQEVVLPLSLVAQIPGRYTAPPSRAYLYYTDEHKQWIPGPQVEIKPRSGAEFR